MRKDNEDLNEKIKAIDKAKDEEWLEKFRKYKEEMENKGKKEKQAWGGIPTVLLVGDDFQLPSIEPGAFTATDDEEMNKILEHTNNHIKRHFLQTWFLHFSGFKKYAPFESEHIFENGYIFEDWPEGCFEMASKKKAWIWGYLSDIESSLAIRIGL